MNATRLQSVVRHNRSQGPRVFAIAKYIDLAAYLHSRLLRHAGLRQKETRYISLVCRRDSSESALASEAISLVRQSGAEFHTASLIFFISYCRVNDREFRWFSIWCLP